MALEIERRFLVRGEAWRSHQLWQAELRQGYLVRGADGLTLRVRLSPDAAWLTLKAVPPLASPAGVGGGGAGGDGDGNGNGNGNGNGDGDGDGRAVSAMALTRLEFEYPIPLADAEALLGLCGDQLSKRRHGLDLPGGDWVLDVFEGDNAPLVLAEVELEAADSPLTIPPWCWREVSGLHALSNAALAARPLARWTPQERQALGL